MEFSEKVLGKSFPALLYNAITYWHCPVAVFMLCWEQWCNVPAHEGLCTETGLAPEQSPYESILPLKIFAKQSYSLISNHMFWVDFVLSVVSVGYLLPLDKASGTCQVIGYEEFQHFPTKWAFLPKVPAQSTALLLFKVSRHIKPNHSMFHAKSASLLPSMCSGQSVCQMLLSHELTPCSVPSCIPWGLCSPLWASGEWEGCMNSSKTCISQSSYRF